MAGKDIIMASQRELKWLHVVHKVLEGLVRQTETAGMLSLSIRQSRRIARRVREEGPQGGVVHRLRGKASNRKLPQELKDRVLELYCRKYEGLVLRWHRRNFWKRMQTRFLRNISRYATGVSAGKPQKPATSTGRYPGG
jgi:hypothetical protein